MRATGKFATLTLSTKQVTPRMYRLHAFRLHLLGQRFSGQRFLGRPYRRWLSSWLFNSIFVAAFTVVLIVGSIPAGFGQISLPNSPETLSLPSGVQRIGSVETAPVRLENRELFRVVAPTVPDRTNLEGRVPVEVRAEQIEANLQRVIALDPNWIPESEKTYNTLFDPNTLRVKRTTLNNQIILRATDDYRQAQDLLTVTEPDARFYALPPDTLAQRWEQTLEERLIRALETRQPDIVKQQLRQALWIGSGVVGISLSLWVGQRLLKSRQKALKTQLAAESAKANDKSKPSNSDIASRAAHRVDFITAIQGKFTLERRITLNAALEWMLFWGQLLLWMSGALWLLFLFPSTAAFAEWLLTLPIAVLVVWFSIGFVNRLGDVLINRFSEAWEHNELFTFEDAQRRSLRISTIIRATKGLKTFIIYIVGLGAALSYAGVPIGSVLTFGAVVAFAVSLASQSLIKDLVNGFLILSEDQYAIGDWIAVGTVDGLVENMNLRITQIRNVEGRLITIPNSLISQVENLTRTWSRTDYRLTVAYNTDVRKAIAVIKDVSQTMYDDPEWHDLLLKPPVVVGVEDVSHAGIVIRVWIDTQPLQQWRAAREFRLRVRIALEKNDIEIGMPQQIVWHRHDVNISDSHISDSHISDSNISKLDASKSISESDVSKSNVDAPDRAPDMGDEKNHNHHH